MYSGSLPLFYNIPLFLLGLPYAVLFYSFWFLVLHTPFCGRDPECLLPAMLFMAISPFVVFYFWQWTFRTVWHRHR